MPVQFSERSEFSAAPDAVFAVLVDPAFLRARAEGDETVAHTESVAQDGDATVVTTSRTVRTDVLPAAAAKFIGATAVVDQVERWGPPEPDGTRRARLTLTVRSAPVELVATTVLAPTPGGSAAQLDGSLTVRVPLLGGQVEKAALPGLLQLIRSEVELAREWLPR
ncbi:DUF2505 domain-containing protein [Kineococcus rhizosphaerae]|uniref:Uncharacterized protein DUF2505 n=1 Tax=Kineococcus rhizosphaerae TaxID=559628 RepID=A0A2T0R3W9_9ACTN|nr:DUF2505 domain-containing protein [Kineococcus rhizosphaerae]PRY14757.1 uncharacterized protein DUF2505 [Kineococcus rhizosphaerae]